LQALSFLLVAAAGGAVVATRDPLRQSMAASFFGLLLSILFTVLQAPDVALSEIVVGAVAYPLMLVLTIAKTGAKGAQ
jgi:energy-converting hydrogenase B subunit D